MKPLLLPRTKYHLFDIAWALLAILSIGLFILGWPLRLEELLFPPASVSAGLESAGLSTKIWAAGMLGAETILMVVCSVVGIILYFQRRKEIVIFLTSLLLITFGSGILNVLKAFAREYPDFELVVRFQNALLWSLVLLIFYIFPNGRFESRWSLVVYAGWVLFSLGWLLFPHSPHNPTRLGAFTSAWVYAAYLGWFLSGLYVLIRRSIRSSSPEERQQTKWVVFGFAGAVFIAFLEELPSLLNPVLVDHSTPEGIMYALSSTGIFVMGVILVPIAIAFSIQNKRLWQIDYLINRGIVYGIMVILMVLGLVGIFSMVNSLIKEFNTTQFEWFSLLLAGLVVIILTKPVYQGLQRQIDARLFGIQIPYKKVNLTHPSSQNREVDWTNQTIGRYKVTKYLRSGKTGRVYHGIEVNTSKLVALKFLHRHLAAIPEHRRDFVSEAKTLSALDHPNISRLLDYGEDGETTCYLVLEYISDQTLANKLKEEGRFKIEQASYVLSQIACALDHAHQRGVVHLDIKPSNIVLRPISTNTYGYTPILTDFGIARETNNRLQSMLVTGTFDYISPEQIHSPSQVDGRADIYSLGVLMYQLVTGQLPFQRREAMAVLIAQINHPPPSILAINPYLPEKTAFAIYRAMSKDPGSRFENASQFAQSFD